MTETAFLQYTGYVLAFFAVWIVARCARSMLSERYVPEVWGYLELPDGTSRASPPVVLAVGSAVSATA